MLHCVIMAGGLGTRFWPMSLQSFPKQFLSMTGDRSLIQSAFGLVESWIPAANVWVVTKRRFAESTQQHLPEVLPQHILREPCGRNTAPCVGIAALCLQAADPNAVMLVMSADHVIGPQAAFEQDVSLACRLVADDPSQLVLFGVPPSYPATGFGYIERAAPLLPGAYQVQAFREKPDRPTAEGYLRDGRFFWNCGIFVWRADRILELLQQHEPQLAALLQTLRPYVGTDQWEQQLEQVFPQMKSISIDYAVLEREQNIAVVEATYDWDDVGSWEAMTRLLPADAAGNTVLGKHLGVDTRSCIIRSSDDHLVATIGIENCVVVHTPRATLVCRRDDENGIRQLIAAMREQGLETHL